MAISVDESFIKLVNIDCLHQDIMYHMGLNKSLTNKKLTFYRRKHILWLIDNANDIPYYMWDVEIPNGETVYEDGEELSSQSIILVNRRCIWHDKSICIASIAKNPWILEFAGYQTDNMCLCAVTQNGMLLEFVKNKTEIICLAAVGRYVWQLLDLIHLH